MSDMRTELDRALRRDPDGEQDRVTHTWDPAGVARHTPYETCPGCSIAELAAANDAAREAHKAAQSYADATAAAWVRTQSALAAALIEHQGDKP